jgi:hypothetical protein
MEKTSFLFALVFLLSSCGGGGGGGGSSSSDATSTPVNTPAPAPLVVAQTVATCVCGSCQLTVSATDGYPITHTAYSFNGTQSTWVSVSPPALSYSSAITIPTPPINTCSQHANANLCIYVMDTLGLTQSSCTVASITYN